MNTEYGISLKMKEKINMEKLFDYNIFLIGFMGAGKSTIAGYLSRNYGMKTVEMDQIIAEREQMSISDIFRLHGEEYFRRLETRLLNEMQSTDNTVISCGGGVPMREVNVQAMKKNGMVVLLDAKPETILERVRNSHDRPLLENRKNVESIAELMEQRRPKYEAAADIRVATDGRSAGEICEDLIRRLRQAE